MHPRVYSTSYSHIITVCKISQVEFFLNAYCRGGRNDETNFKTSRTQLNAYKFRLVIERMINRHFFISLAFHQMYWLLTKVTKASLLVYLLFLFAARCSVYCFFPIILHDIYCQFPSLFQQILLVLLFNRYSLEASRSENSSSVKK